MLTMQEIATKIAYELGTFYTLDYADMNEQSAHIINTKEDKQFVITLYHDLRSKKITINGKMPMCTDNAIMQFGTKPDLSIGVGRDRDPSAIASAIKSRFLPGYKEAFAAAIIQRDERNAYLKKQQETLIHFATLLNGKVRGETVDVPMGDSDKYGYLWDVQIGGTVKLDFRSLPPDVAKRILKAWKQE